MPQDLADVRSSCFGILTFGIEFGRPSVFDRRVRSYVVTGDPTGSPGANLSFEVLGGINR